MEGMGELLLSFTIETGVPIGRRRLYSTNLQKFFNRQEIQEVS